MLLWAFSEGRVATLVLLAALPAVLERVEVLFSARDLERPSRTVVGLGVAVALPTLVHPGALLAVGPIVAAGLLAGWRRIRGLVLSLLGLAAAAALSWPLALEVARDPAASLASYVGTVDPWRVLRLAPGGGPGSWVVGAFLPVSALVCFAVVGPEHRGSAWRAMLLALAAVGLGWASAARWLPPALTNQPAYLSLAAVAEAALLGYGLAALGARLGREAFGIRQVSAFALGAVLGLGLAGQFLGVVLGGWAVDRNGLPPAWPLIEGASGGFRILWIGGPGPGGFPAPGGDPIGVVEAGPASVRYGLTDRDGVSALDLGRAATGPGYRFLEEVLEEVVAGSTRHAGTLLAPLGVRFVVAAEGDLPPAVRARLEEQLDLVRIPAGGLVIYRNPRALPVASVVSGEAFARASAGSDLAPLAALPRAAVAPLRPVEGGFRAETEGGTLYLAWQFDPGWRIRAVDAVRSGAAAFGWAIRAPVEAGPVEVDHRPSPRRAVELGLVGGLWLLALWVTRRPAER
ncbi:hypothetical protein HRbin12_00303 [bacterium HR12]|nr:hypothetical protein HRbin12_00303 [bacterium HR12]